jgi:hypothetical protein
VNSELPSMLALGFFTASLYALRSMLFVQSIDIASGYIKASLVLFLSSIYTCISILLKRRQDHAMDFSRWTAPSQKPEDVRQMSVPADFSRLKTCKEAAYGGDSPVC